MLSDSVLIVLGLSGVQHTLIMRIVYCYIGVLPEYIIDSVYQARLFYKDGEIDCITDDIKSSIASTLQEKYRVNIVPYVKDVEFYDCVYRNKEKLPILHDLKGREQLFIYSYDRYFTLYHYLKGTGYTDILFLELDILLYDDPMKWKSLYEPNAAPMAYMYDHVNRCAGGICYIRNSEILMEFTKFCINYITYTDPTKAYMTEMQALYWFWKKNLDKIQLLPIHWPEVGIPPETSENYDRYHDTIFDAAALGIYLTGFDPYHTKGIIRTGLQSVLSAINYTRYNYDWKTDDEGRMIPYIKKHNQWIRINNLHVHSKQLFPYLSK